jgi:hypothetical protein
MRAGGVMSALLLFTMAPATLADQTFDLVSVDNSAVLPGEDTLVPDFNDGSYFTFDVMITTQQSYFLAAEMQATLEGPAEFFQHPIGGEVPPDPNLLADYPAVEFDTFLDAGGRDDPVYVVPPYVEEPQFIHAYWWSAGGPNPPEGTYRIARLSFRFTEPATATLHVSGESWDSPGYHMCPIGPFTIPVEYVPEPSMLALLSLAGLLRLRRSTRRV